MRAAPGKLMKNYSSGFACSWLMTVPLLHQAPAPGIDGGLGAVREVQLA
jgi:hypothetical protein